LVVLATFLVSPFAPTKDIYSQPSNQGRVLGKKTPYNQDLHPIETYYGRIGIRTLYEMLKDLKVEIFPEDIVSAFPDPSFGMGSKIIVQRATPINLKDANEVTLVRTWANNVNELLEEKNIKLGELDRVEPSRESALSINMEIKITRVSQTPLTEYEEVPFKTIKLEDRDLEKGQTRLQQKGVKGKKEIIYLVKRVNGEEISRKVTSTKIVKDPVDEIIIIGIGPKLAKSGPYKDIINAAAKKYLINGTALMCLMLKESQGHPDSKGCRDPITNQPTCFGLFQYKEGFWASASKKAGYAGASIYDPEAQIYTTAWALTVGGLSSRWGNTWPLCRNK
jgi:hypothetical protein